MDSSLSKRQVSKLRQNVNTCISIQNGILAYHDTVIKVVINWKPPPNLKNRPRKLNLQNARVVSYFLTGGNRPYVDILN